MPPGCAPEHRNSSYSRGEEIAHSVSHGVGLLAVAVGTPFLVAAAAQRGTAAEIVGATVFGTTAVLLYLASTLYHAVPSGKAKRVFRRIDHGAIYCLIAGTYTPFTLGVLRGAWGWSLLGIVWGLAAVGVVTKAALGQRLPRLTMGLYIVMGWLVVVAVKPLWLRVPTWGLVWLAAGGAAYMVGLAFYASERIRYNHFVWHLFVLAGTGCHYVAVLHYAV